MSTVYSFSRLSAFEQCKYQYYLTYCVNIWECKSCGKRHIIPKKTNVSQCECGCDEFTLININEENAFNQFGSFCHAILERFAKGEMADYDDEEPLEVYEMLDEYEDNFNLAVTKDFPPNQFVDLAKSYYDGGYEYFRSFEGFDYLVEGYKVLGVEWKFEVEFDDFKLTGFIDLVLEDPQGNIIIVDHKSKKKFANKREQKEYARQMYLYATYIYDKYGKWPVMLIFNMFRAKPCFIKFKLEDYEEAVAWARERVREIEAALSDNNFRWEPVTGDEFWCSAICGFRNNCELKEIA